MTAKKRGGERISRKGTSSQSVLNPRMTPRSERSLLTQPGLGLVSFYRHIKFGNYLSSEIFKFQIVAEAAKRLKIMETQSRDKLVPKLRVESRRKYLEKRKEDKVAELEADILDDEYLFEDQMSV